jgi:Tol biopolymer transport system component
MIGRRWAFILVITVLALGLVSAGTVEAKKPPPPPPTPEPPANPEIVLNYDYKSGPYFGLINADGSNETPIFFEGFEPGPHHLGTWSPDGQRLAMQVYTGQQALWSSDLDGSNAIELVEDGLYNVARWSPAIDTSLPSYNKVAYCDGWTGDIMMVDADGGTPEVVFDSDYPSPGYTWYEEPSWSSDGSRLAAVSHGPDSPDQIVVVTVGSGDPPEVLFESESYPSPYGLDWARQHDWMAFHEMVDGVVTVCVLDLDSSTVYPVLPYKKNASWSPDDSGLLVVTAQRYKVDKNVMDNHLYVYEGFDETDFDGGSLTFVHHGHWPEWKRCVTDPVTGVCEIPSVP